MKFFAGATVFATLLVNQANAWGSIGHQLTGYIADHLANKHTIQVSTALLNGWNMSRTTTWADDVKYNKSLPYGWSGPLHYIDIEDNPPHECGLNLTRDCPDGNCIVGAIANYTNRLDCSGKQYLPVNDRSDALKFLIHFIGDITQPLHACNRQIGGNTAFAIFDGANTTQYGKVQLHAIWDTYIIEKRLKNDFNDSFTAYGDFLVHQILKGAYAHHVPLWNSCLRKKSNHSKHDNHRALRCAIMWAKDSDKLDCSVVWPAYDADPKADLGLDYYKNAIPVVDMQLAKAGARMAALLDKELKKCHKYHSYI
ncbi:S1/P1 nuclease [Jimgerdemannia flammicorona]|uniref:S1/P1 nuclease n=1 Tax=Jimgerdemannia flammicorona TaxID=994334 RepID=A0A433BD20_9FUNG|nr:S1/P1 nuclease [Jimgerdemannia flammicorona]